MTVVILAITVSLAVPAVISGVRRVQLNRLDDSARAIFLAAQNSLTAMVGNGELETFAKDVTGNTFTGEPSDFPADSGVYTDLRYLDSMGSDEQKAALKKLLPGGSIDKELEKHHYVVEYNCKTGAVYAVWYSNKDFTYTGEPRDYDKRLKESPLIGYYGGSGVDYAAVGQMPIPKLTLTNAEELRLHIKMPDKLPGSTGFDTEKIGLEVVIKGKTSGGSKTIIARGSSVLLDEGKEADIMLDTLKGATPAGTLTGADGEWTIRKPFKEWIEEIGSTPTLIPGEDISVTVTAYYAGSDDKLYLPQGATVSCNSLFASVEGDDPTTGVVEPQTAMIAYGRHLQNLDAFISTDDADGAIGENAAGTGAITAAEQIRKIDFAAVNGTKDAAGTFTHGDDSKDIYYWADTYGTVDKTTGVITDPKPFTAIYNSALKSYDGGSLSIRHLNAKKNSREFMTNHAVAAGLFAYFGTPTGSTGLSELKNIVLIDTDATDTDAHNVGALAGIAENANIINCQVYLEEALSSSSATSPTVMVEGSSRVGGLVGAAYGAVQISDSFAATVAKNGESSPYGVGGLVGEEHTSSSSLTIERSYAACYLMGGYHVGGLVGNCEGGTTVTISNSYAAGIIAKVYTGKMAAGLVAHIDGDTLTIKNSYAAVRYGNDAANASKATVSPLTIYGAAPNLSMPDNVYFVSQTDVTYAENSGTSKITTELSQMDVTALTTAGEENVWYQMPAENATTANPTYATFPYRQTAETAALDTPYPYPMLMAYGVDPAVKKMPMLHYGDWLESETEIEPTMAYYDIIDGNIGYYAISDGTVPINTLGDEGAATTDGYTVLSEYELTGTDLSFTLNESATSYTLVGGGDVTIVGTKYYKYNLPKDAWEAAVKAAEDAAKSQTGNYYQKLTLGGGQVLLFNPLFACEAVSYPKDTPPDDTLLATAQEKPGLTSKTASGDVIHVDTDVVLRTPRHLANAAKWSADDTSVPNGSCSIWRTKAYHQLLDIDYSKYKMVNNDSSLTFTTGTSDAQTPLLLGDREKNTSGGTTAAGAYYGNTHVIRDVSIGKVGARETSSSGGGSTRQVAGLFGLVTNGSAVDGVRLVNATVTAAPDTKYVGAVAGKVAGEKTKFTDCGVYIEEGNTYNTYVVSTTGKGASVGGFVGEFEGKATGCFAAVQVKATGASSSAGGFAGTFKDATVTNCYAGGHTEEGVYVSDDKSVNVWVTGETSNAGGFAGSITEKKTLSLQGVCYTTCSVRNDQINKESKEPEEYNGIGLFVGLRPDSNTTPSTKIERDTDAILYTTGVAFKNNAIIDPHTESTYLTELIPEVGERFNYTFTANPYDYDRTKGDTPEYPYITNLEAHYGDWPTKLNLVYYEVYNQDPGTGAVEVNGRWYGFYGRWFDKNKSEQKPNTLARSEDAYAVDAGYALVTDQDLTSFTWGTENYGSATGRTMKYGTAKQGDDGWVKLKKTEHSDLPADFVYTLPFEALNQAPLDTYYRVISVNGGTTVCNPHFACEALNNSNSHPKTMYLDGSKTRYYTYSDFSMNDIQSKPGLVDAPADGDYKDYNDCVIIRTPQHLASAARYTRENNNLNRENSRGWAYHQLLDLDYGKYTGGIYDGNSGVRKSNDEKNIAGTKLDYPQLAVTLGQEVTSGDDKKGSYDGHGHTIANLFAGISQESEKEGFTNEMYAGVFGWVYGSTIKNLKLQNITVNVGTSNSDDRYDAKIKGNVLAVGGLAGRCSGNSTVSGVTLKDVKINVGSDAAKAKDIGGLFGSVEGAGTKINGCGIRAGESTDTGYNNHVVTYSGSKSNSSTGGFAGSITDATVQSCYAAVKVTGYNCAGGFVGQIKADSGAPTFTDCYAGGHTKDGIYDPKAPNVTATYGSSSSTVGGFAGAVTSGEAHFDGVNYSTCSVGCDYSSASRGRFVGKGNENVKKVTSADDVLYGFAPAFRNNSAVAPTDETDYLTDQLAALKDTDKAKATPYDTHWSDTYPYQVAAGQTMHYGDWMDLAEPSLVYYEKYATSVTTPGTTHIVADGALYGLGGSWKHADGSEDKGIDSLSKDPAEKITGDGYALLWPVDASYPYTQNFPETLECDVDGKTVTFKRIEGTETGDYEHAIKLQSAYYYLYLPDPLTTDLNALFKYTSGGSYYQKLTYTAEITEDGVSCTRTGDRWFNPHFALEAYNTEPELKQPTVKQKNMLNDETTDERAVIVRTARQFGNLDGYAVSGNESAKWHYHQTMDIDFESTTPFAAAPVPVLETGGIYNGHLHCLTNLQVEVKQTTNSNLYVGVFGQISGATVQNVQLLNSEVAVTSTNSSTDTTETNVGGLVGRASGSAKLENNTGINVRVTAKVEGTKGNARVGGLFGRLQGGSSGTVEVKNCGVYVDTEHAAAGHTDIDGDDGAYNYYSVDAGASTISTTSGNNDYTGGLAGDVNQASLEKCFAAVKVTGYKYTGGLAGQLTGTADSPSTVTDCYAGGHTVDGEYKTPTAAKTPEVNVTGLRNGDAHVGGFTGQTAGGVTFKGVCYTTCSVFAPNTEKNKDSDNTTKYLGLFSGEESSGTSGTVTYTGSTLYATGKAWAKNNGTPAAFEEATPRSETVYGDTLLTEREELLKVLVEVDYADSIPYDDELMDTGTLPDPTPASYIYKTNFEKHHGDWGLPDETPVQAAGILYFELDADDNFTYQIAGVTSKGALLSEDNAKDFGFTGTVTDLDTLCIDRHVNSTNGAIEEKDHIKTSGYVLFNGDKFRLTSPTKDTAELTYVEDTTKETTVRTKVLEILNATTKEQLDELQIFVTPSISGKNVNKKFSRRGYHSTERQLYYTDGFAGVSAEAYTKDNPVAIRTVRQLDNIGGTELYFKQTHDLYGEGYRDGSGNGYTGAEAFKGSYDGDHRYILDLNMSGTKNVGLFNTIATTNNTVLQNIILYSPEGNATITSTEAYSSSSTGSSRWGAGGLVGGITTGNTSSAVTITNCVVAGYTIKSHYTIGGLVGYAYYKVKIDNCAAVNMLSNDIDFNNKSDKVSIGGLVGGYHSGAGTEPEIENSYAGGKVELTETDQGGNIIGGIIGKDDNTTSTGVVKNCYTYLDMTGVPSNDKQANTVYAIGPLLTSNTEGNAYWANGLPKPKTTTTTPTGNPKDTLTVETENQGIITPDGDKLPTASSGVDDAVRSYVPAGQMGGTETSDDGKVPRENTTTATGYPYKAVVKDWEDKLIHYGSWPTP